MHPGRCCGSLRVTACTLGAGQRHENVCCAATEWRVSARSMAVEKPRASAGARLKHLAPWHQGTPRIARGYAHPRMSGSQQAAFAGQQRPQQARDARIEPKYVCPAQAGVPQVSSRANSGAAGCCISIALVRMGLGWCRQRREQAPPASSAACPPPAHAAARPQSPHHALRLPSPGQQAAPGH